MFPGDLGLTPADIAELSAKMQGSQPLVPQAFGRGDRHVDCWACKAKVLKRTAVRECAFCNAVVHVSCVVGPGRPLAEVPARLRCPPCVRELPDAFRFADYKLKLRGLSLSPETWAWLSTSEAAEVATGKS